MGNYRSMKNSCAWCNKFMKHGQQVVSGLVSHGICIDCTKSLFELDRLSLVDFLDSLDAPVLVINADGSVCCLNEQAKELLQTGMPETAGSKSGNVFGCAYAVLDGECGGTILCDACAILRTVLDTIQNGHSYLRAPAYLTRGTLDDSQDIRFLISTEKVADSVLLRIDEMEGAY